jgi:glycerate 2-kinase
VRPYEPPDTQPLTERERSRRPPPVGAGHPDWTVLICPDKFKGTLTAEEAALAMERGVKAVWPHCVTRLVPLADGGDGTLDALLANGGTRHEMLVRGPSGQRHVAAWGKLDDGTAVIEMAQASGLAIVGAENNDLLTATTWGTGELIRAALEAGCRKFIIGLGGSATNDGGIGAMAALGARFLDADEKELDPVAASLQSIARIDLEGFADVMGREFTIASDVDNRLCGRHGATFDFGPQKGGRWRLLRRLERGMRNYARVLVHTFDWDVAMQHGAGAAGGLGAALLGFLRAGVLPGVEVVMDAAYFDRLKSGADLVVTGEGRLDATSLRGKVVHGVLRAVSGVPIGIVCGSRDISRKNWADLQVLGVRFIADASHSERDSMRYPHLAVEQATATGIREWLNERS